MTKLPKPAIVAFTPRGRALADRAASWVGGEVVMPEGPVAPALRDLFEARRPIVGVCAAGVLIRALAPALSDKWSEPPVLALAEDGSAVAPLLGGHRGANDLARVLADGLGAAAAVTTASDATLGVALDAPPPGWRVATETAEDRARLRSAAARLLGGARGVLQGAASPWLAPLVARLDGRLTVRETLDDGPRATLRVEGADGPVVYHQVCAALGVGCARGADADEMAALARASLVEAGLSPLALTGVFSIDLKTDEAAVHAVARALTPWAPARFFSAEALAAEEPRLATPSEVVRAEVGVAGVAEAAALAALGPEAALRTPKRTSATATAAVAVVDWAARGSALAAPPGRARGTLFIVGVGPGGGAGDVTGAAATALRASAVHVGYGLYLDLAAAYRASDARVAAYPLGAETERCRAALEEAGRGETVALVCSGDGGIYAMGALVMELLDRPEGAGGVSAAARRAAVVSVPGVSAMQAASARAGALLGHDFCAISLSDLLTPWAAIEARVRAAAAGDFVVAFYNPVSQKRRTQLARARDLLLERRPAETPVLMATNLGRPGETLRRRTLGALDPSEVDMLTVVLVGSSQSRVVETGDVSAGAEGAWLYTPRGYAAKAESVGPITAGEDGPH